MEWFIAVIAVAALGVAAIAAAGGMGEMSKNPVYDTYRQDLPETALTPTDIGQLKFGIALRGYAMSQVDDVLDRLAREIAERDARIAELTSASRPVLAHEPTVAPHDPTDLDDPNP
ncbi:MAG TPA: DivIVA domain-containing protein [Propionibacteriaceae bacterium]|nr:DivIVA domain-containing protein [Propionibacteriaceae bacterium]